MARLRMIGLTVGSLAPLACFAGLAACPAVVLAQTGKIKAVEPYYAVVVAERASVRAGDHDSYYVVTDATKGQLLRVDGEDTRWSRVSYLADWPAFVKAADGSFDAATKSFTLSKPATLMAFSVVSPDHPWQALLSGDRTTASGTKLKVLGEVKDSTGQVKGYKVVAPEGAQGFVETRNLRKASKEEVDAARAKGVLGSPAATPAPVATPVVAPGSAPSSNPGETKPTPGVSPAPGADRSLVEPQKPVGPESAPTPGQSGAQANPTPPNTSLPGAATPATTPGAQPADPATIPQGSDPSAKPTEPVKPAEPVKREPTAAERQAATLTQIDEAFRKLSARDTDLFTAEYDQLIAEINKTIAGLGTSPNDEGIKKQLQLRSDMLKLRADLRDSMKTVEESRRKLNESILKTSKVVAEAEKSKVYTAVGTLSSSDVYDGKNLPKMYRVVSADTGSPVTLGYLKPEAALALESKLGQVVGVIGEAAVDPTLKLNIITPVRVDVIGQAASGDLPTIPAAPAPQAKPDEKPAIPAPKAKDNAPAKPGDIIK